MIRPTFMGACLAVLLAAPISLSGRPVAAAAEPEVNSGPSAGADNPTGGEKASGAGASAAGRNAAANPPAGGKPAGGAEPGDAGELKDLSLEQLMDVQVRTVYSASKRTQTLAEAPASVTIVTADEIRKYGYHTLADILRSVPGFYVTYDRNYSYLGVEGFGRTGDYNARVLLMVDGHRVNDNIYSGAPIGTEFNLDVDLIDRVEIVPGPASALYGNNAFFAVINVITRRGSELKGAEVSGGYGSFDSYQARTTYGNEFGADGEYLLSLTRYSSEGDRLHFDGINTPPAHPGWTETDGDQNFSAFGRLSLCDWALSTAFVNREKQIPTGAWGTIFDDPRNRTVDQRWYADLAYDHWLDPDTNISGRVAFDYFNYHGDYVYPASGSSPVINHDLAWSQALSTQWNISRHFFDKHLLTAGFDAQDNLIQGQRNYDVAVYLDDARTSQNAGVYLMDDWTILKNLRLNAGLRYDDYTTFGGTLNPRVALIYNPLQATTLKLIYGQAFRAPNASELYYQDGGRTSEAPKHLDPESIQSWQFIAEQQFAKRLRVTANLFDNRITDLITQETDPKNGLLVYENLGSSKAMGAECELDGSTESGIQGRASYTLERATDAETGEVLVNSPEDMLKLNLILPAVRDKLFLGVEWQYMSNRKTLAGGYTSPFMTTNVTLFATKLARGLDASASVYNLFNQRYSDPGGPEQVMPSILQDGRTFWLKLTYRF